MPPYAETDEDWAPHEDEIRSLFIENDWTLKATMKFMEDNHGFRATAKQYRRRFGGNKNIRKDEWAPLGALVRKRKLVGKDTSVYRGGRQVTPERIIRELARHKAKIDQFEQGLAASPLLDAKFFLQTPPSLSPTFVPNSPLSISYAMDEDGLDIGNFNELGLKIILDDQRNYSADNEDAVSNVSIPSFMIDRYDLGNLANLDRKLWTYNLPSLRFQNDLFDSLRSTSQFGPLGLNTSFSIPRSPSETWLADVTKHINSSASSQNITQVPGTEGMGSRDYIDLLQHIAFRFSNNMLPDLHHAMLVFDPTHAGLLKTLVESKSIQMIYLAKCLLVEVGTHLWGDLSCRQTEITVRLATWMLRSVFPLGFLRPDDMVGLFSLALQKYYPAAGEIVEAITGREDFDLVQGKRYLLLGVIHARWKVVDHLVHVGVHVPAHEVVNALSGAGDAPVSSSRGLKCILRLFALAGNLDEKNERRKSYGASRHNYSPREWCAMFQPDVYHQLPQRAQSQQPCLASITYAAHNDSELTLQLIKDSSVQPIELQVVLFEAVRWGMVNTVNILLQAGVDPNAPCAVVPYLHHHILTIAARHYSVDMAFELMAMLLQRGADITKMYLDTQSFRSQYRPIGPVMDIIIWHVRENMNRDALQRPGISLLCLAVTLEEKGVINELLSLGVDINGIDCRRTMAFPLLSAVRSKSLGMVKFLWDKGARLGVEQDVRMGNQELMAAAILDPSPARAELIKFLVDKGAILENPDGMEDEHIQPVLIWVVQTGHGGLMIEDVRVLVEHGAQINRAHDAGCGFWITSLQCACWRGNLPLVQYLESVGGDIHLPAHEKNGRTALQCAAEGKYTDLVHYLLAKGAEANECPASVAGRTALQASAANGDIEIAIKLLECGADVSAPGALHLGRTAIEAAAEYGRLDMVKLLINAGAKGDVTNEERFAIAIELAEEGGYLEVVELLQEHQ